MGVKIGITGHQDINRNLLEWINKNICDELNKINVDCGYSSLAVGADQIFANILLQNKIPLNAIIPSQNYSETFGKENLDDYLNILKKADNIIQLNFNRPSEEAFYAAGKKIADFSDILFAIWDGLPAEGLGGTGDVFKYMKLLDKKIIHFNIKTKEIIYINQ